MLRFLFLFIFIVVTMAQVLAQAPADSVVLPPRDTGQVVTVTPVDTGLIRKDSIGSLPLKDSLSMRPVMRDNWEIDAHIPFAYQILGHHPYFDFMSKPVSIPAYRRVVQGKEILFYVVMGLLLLFALLKQAFGKYFNDLFRVFFRTTLKQRQVREQLQQNLLASLVFSAFFIASAGLYLNLMLHYFWFAPGSYTGLASTSHFWLLYMYCCIGLTVIYTVKFIGLKITGWLFNMKNAADSYIFIVFIINKVLGITLLPFLILLSFADEPIHTVSLVVSWCGIGVLLFYRLILGFAAIRNEVRFNLFHFFLYLCAFEITPLLLIYKLLLLIF